MTKTSSPLLAVMGLYHLGFVYAAGFAQQGYSTYVYDDDKTMADAFKQCKPPLFEPHLQETLESQKKQITFISSPEIIFREAKYIFITVDLWVQDGALTNLDKFNTIIRLVEQYGSSNNYIVISSQISAGTSKRIYTSLKKKWKTSPKLIYFPENLRLGDAMHTFLHPKNLIIGCNSTEVGAEFMYDFSAFHCPFHLVSFEDAEFAKHAINMYLATCISLSNELSDLAEKIGADMNSVVQTMKLDNRISAKAPITPGLGFSGGTITRDVHYLTRLSLQKRVSTPTIHAVNVSNSKRLEKIIGFINHMQKEETIKHVGIMGLSYKPGTNEVLGSSAIALIQILQSSYSFQLTFYDPLVSQNDVKNLNNVQKKLLPHFFSNLDLVIIMTPSPEFALLKPENFGPLMRKKNVIDGVNILDHNTYRAAGFHYLRIVQSRHL